MISFQTSGSTKMESYLESMLKLDIRPILQAAGEAGVTALEAHTPVDSGLAEHSWQYRIETTKTGLSVIWYNTDNEHGFPVAIMLQYGHGTGTGGYVQGRDYINPAMKPIFDRISDDVRKAVNST